MALTNYQQSPNLAFMQSRLLAFSETLIDTSKIIKSLSRRKILYNVAEYRVLNGRLESIPTVWVPVPAYAIPVHFSDVIPVNQWYLPNTVQLDVVYEYTVSNKRLTNPVKVIKIPYQIDSKDCWDGESYIIKGDKIYSDWYEDRDYYKSASTYYFDKILTSEYRGYVYSYLTDKIYKNIFDPTDTNLYGSWNLWDTNQNKAGALNPASYVPGSDKFIAITEDLGLPYMKRTASQWVINAVLIDGFYLFDVNSLTVLDPDSQTYYGNNGSYDMYLKYYETPVLCYNRYLSGWILSPYETLPHTTPADWIGKSLYNYTGASESFIGAYRKYAVSELTQSVDTPIYSGFILPDGTEPCPTIVLPGTTYGKGIKKKITLTYNKSMSPDYYDTDPAIDPEYVSVEYGSCYYYNQAYSMAQSVQSYDQGLLGKYRLKQFIGDWPIVQGDEIGWQGPGYYSYIYNVYIYPNTINAQCPHQEGYEYTYSGSGVYYFATDPIYHPCLIPSAHVTQEYKFTAFYGGDPASCIESDPDIAWQGPGVYCYMPEYRFFDRAITLDDCEAEDYVSVTKYGPYGSYLAVPCSIHNTYYPAKVQEYMQGTLETLYDLTPGSNYALAELSNKQTVYVIGETLHE